MIIGDEVFRQGSQEQAWNKYCGFLDLSLSEFMEIQEQLLMKQIDTVFESPLAKSFMPGKPSSVPEFRQMVRLTTYGDYATYLNNKNEDVLAFKPCCWARTSGRGVSPKWVPYSERFVEVIGKIGIAILILACASRKGEVKIGKGTRLMQNLPPEPYVSGIGTKAMAQQLELCFIPPLESSETQSFEERIQAGFKMALRTGIDVLGSLTTVLVKMGERFSENQGQVKLSWRMLHPLIILRLMIAWVRCKREKRNILPRDLWPLKGLICYGMDTNIYREQLVHYWGREPLEIYGGTEMGSIATEVWNKKWMTFNPFFCFLEFIPEEEWQKNRDNKTYQPSTVLLNEVKAGKRYEVVLTQFYGMPLLRYRIGDLIKIVALKDEETGIVTPQMTFDSRADDLIDIAGFTRLDEKTIWQAIVDTGIKYEDWSIRKEYEHNQSILRLYIELKQEIDTGELEKLVHRALAKIYPDYRDLEAMLGIRPLKVSILPAGSFQRYYQKKKTDGADLAHLKPPHMNPSDIMLQDLLS
jgi:hypothetical protein